MIQPTGSVESIRLGVNVDQGLGFLGASREGTTNQSRQGARSDFTKARITASRLQRLGGRFSLLASFASQFSFAKLPASEEFGVGGERCGRAYDASEITGDHGACLLLEMRYDHRLAANSSTGFQLYGFYDVGGVWRKVPGPLGNKAHLSSVGIGARFNVTEQLSGSLEVAWPQTNEVDDRQIDVGSRRGFIAITSRF